MKHIVWRKAALVQRRSQKIAVAVLGHPACASQMTVVDAMSAFTVAVRIKPEQDTDDFGPIRTLCGGIEKADIERKMLAIVIGKG